MIKIIVIILLLICVNAQFNNNPLNQQILGNTIFNQHRTNYEYVKPQSIGAGFQSAGGYVKMHETYHSPQSIGGGFQSRDGWSKEQDKPYVGQLHSLLLILLQQSREGVNPNNFNI